MENTRGKIPIPKASGLRPPNRNFGVSRELPALPTFAPPKIAPLRRRSKSVTDLRMNVLQPIATNMVPFAKSTSTTSLRQGVKRTGPDIKKTEVKPKVARPNLTKPTTSKVEKKDAKPVAAVPKRPKIAPYDYKARFNLLTEKYELLKTQLTDAKEQIAQCKILQADNADLKNKVAKIEKERFDLENQRSVLKSECTVLHLKVEKMDELKDKLINSEANYNKTLRELNEAKETLIDFNSALAEIEELKKVVAKCKTQMHQDGTIRRALHNQVQDLKGNIRVFCRVRPPLRHEIDRLECNINYINEFTLELRKAKESISTNLARNNDLLQDFTYDQVFGPQSTQVDVFEELSHLVQSALDGYHVCVFAYGQTGSGKTFTMQGDNTENARGMIPRSIECLFQGIANLKLSGWDYEVQASFLEIYNENIRDLLNSSIKQSHDIRFNEGKGVTVTNLQIEPINSEYDLKVLMKRAEKNRSVATTNYNEHSSRSHAVTKIYLRGVETDSETVYTGSLNLVDLAGSECAETSTTERIAETKHINKSLAALGNVMLALHNKDSHIPYRDSKLTYLLQSCLGGNSKTLMIVNIAPFEDCYQESMSSLRFAAKVKEVKTNSKRNKTIC